MVGEPTYPGMKKWKRQMNANLISVKTPQTWGQGKGHLGLLQDPVVFHSRNGAAHNPLNAAPLPYPLISQGASTAAREELRATNEVQTFDWDRYQHTHRITVNIGTAVFKEWVIAIMASTSAHCMSTRWSDSQRYRRPKSTRIWRRSMKGWTLPKHWRYKCKNRSNALRRQLTRRIPSPRRQL